MRTSTTGSNATTMRRSFRAVTISSVTRILTRRCASRSTFGFHSRNEPARRRLAASSVSWARLIASSALRAKRGMLTAPIEAVTETGPDLVGTISSRTAARKRSAATMVSSTVQLLQDQPELVAGEPPEHVAAAQPRADAFSDFRDHPVGDIEAEGIVDAGEMVDADQAGRRRSSGSGRIPRSPRPAKRSDGCG